MSETCGTDEREPRVTVMVVDDHPIWRDAVARDLAAAGFVVVATAGDGPQAVRRARAARPDVLVLDLNLPGLPGAEVCRQLAGTVPAANPHGATGAGGGGSAESPGSGGGAGPRVLVLSASEEQADVLEAVKAGATGYLVKSASAEDLVAAVRRTAKGDPVFTPGLAGLVLGEYRRLAAVSSTPRGAGGPRDAPQIPRLTERETEVLRLVAKGLTYRQIADRLVISHRTVQNHVQNTLGKLQLHNRAELVRYAVERGLHT